MVCWLSLSGCLHTGSKHASDCQQGPGRPLMCACCHTAACCPKEGPAWFQQPVVLKSVRPQVMGSLQAAACSLPCLVAMQWLFNCFAGCSPGTALLHMKSAHVWQRVFCVVMPAGCWPPACRGHVPPGRQRILACRGIQLQQQSISARHALLRLTTAPATASLYGCNSAHSVHLIFGSPWLGCEMESRPPIAWPHATQQQQLLTCRHCGC